MKNIFKLMLLVVCIYVPVKASEFSCRQSSADQKMSTPKKRVTFFQGDEVAPLDRQPKIANSNFMTHINLINEVIAKSFSPDIMAQGYKNAYGVDLEFLKKFLEQEREEKLRAVSEIAESNPSSQSLRHSDDGHSQHNYVVRNGLPSKERSQHHNVFLQIHRFLKRYLFLKTVGEKLSFLNELQTYHGYLLQEIFRLYLVDLSEELRQRASDVRFLNCLYTTEFPKVIDQYIRVYMDYIIAEDEVTDAVRNIHEEFRVKRIVQHAKAEAEKERLQAVLK